MINTGNDMFGSGSLVDAMQSMTTAGKNQPEKNNGFTAELDQHCREENRPTEEPQRAETDDYNTMEELTGAAAVIPPSDRTADSFPAENKDAAATDKPVQNENKAKTTGDDQKNTGKSSAPEESGQNKKDVKETAANTGKTLTGTHADANANANASAAATTSAATATAIAAGRHNGKPAAAEARQATTVTENGANHKNITTAADLRRELGKDTGAVIHSVTVTQNTAGEKKTATDKTATPTAATAETWSTRRHDTVTARELTTRELTTKEVTANADTVKTTGKNTTGQEQPQNLLKQLDTGKHSGALRKATVKTSDESDMAEAKPAVGTGNKTVTAAEIKTQAAVNAERKSGLTESGEGQLRSMPLLHNAAGRGLENNPLTASTVNTTPYLQMTDRIGNLEQIMDKVRENLPLAAASAGSTVKIDFEAGSLGRLQLQIQQQGDSINIVIEPGSDSSRQELLNQQQELAKMIRNLGYREMSLDIAERQQQQNSRQQKSFSSGNELSENVKLAGNDQNDLLQLLAMN